MLKQSIDISLVRELVINPPSASPSVVASVYGAAAVVPSASAVAHSDSGAGKAVGQRVLQSSPNIATVLSRASDSPRLIQVSNALAN